MEALLHSPLAPLPFGQPRQLLGGARLFKPEVSTRSEVHQALMAGVPWAAFNHLMGQLNTLHEDDVARVLGVSTRTLRRQRDTPKKNMPADLASKVWLLAETLAKAGELMGGTPAAERWLIEPAMALDNQRPVDLLCTWQGAELVSELLGRLEHGVYA